MIRSALFAVTVVLLLGTMLIGTDPAFGAELKVGQKAPGFELPTIFGDSTFHSREVFPQSTLTVLILWTSYCPDCWKALKSCHDLSAQVKELGVNVIGINFDTEKLATVRGFIKGEKIDFVNLSDYQKKTARLYRAESYDFSSFIVDSTGILQYVSYDHPPEVDEVILKEIHRILQKNNDDTKSKEKPEDKKENKDRKV